MTKQKSICFVQNHYYKYTVGGAEVQAYLLAKGFLKAGWRVYYITTDVRLKEVNEGISLYPFTSNASSNINFSDIYANLAKIDADLFYQRGRGKYTHILSRFCSISNKPFISALSMDIDCRRYKNMPRAYEKGFRVTPRAILGLLRNFWLDLNSLNGLRKASVVLCQSEDQRQALQTNLGIAGIVFKNVHPIPDEHSIAKSKPLMVLWLASIKEWKQPEIFIALADRLKDLNCRFVMAGRIVSSRYRKLISEATKRISNFEYIEDVSFERSNELIGQASLFLNTSLCNEGFPNTFIQAWLRKTPTVTLKFDPDSTITNMSLGRLSGSFEELVRDVATLIKDSREREEMGRRARIYACKEFGLDENFPLLHELALDLANGKGLEKCRVYSH